MGPVGFRAREEILRARVRLWWTLNGNLELRETAEAMGPREATAIARAVAADFDSISIRGLGGALISLFEPRPMSDNDSLDELYARAFELRNAGDNEQALVVLADLLNQFEESPEPPDSRAIVASAILLAANAASDIGQQEPALELYERCIARYAQEPAPELRVIVTKAVASKAATLVSARRLSDAIATYDYLIDGITPGVDSQLDGLLADGLSGRAYCYEALDRTEPAKRDYDAILELSSRGYVSANNGVLAIAREGVHRLE